MKSVWIMVMFWFFKIYFIYALEKLLYEITTENFIEQQKKENSFPFSPLKIDQKYNTSTVSHITFFPTSFYLIHGTRVFLFVFSINDMHTWHCVVFKLSITTVKTTNVIKEKNEAALIITSMSSVALVDGYWTWISFLCEASHNAFLCDLNPQTGCWRPAVFQREGLQEEMK